MKKFFSKIVLISILVFSHLGGKLIDGIDKCIHRLFDVERGQLKHIPNFVIFLIYALCLSVIFQAALDFVIEILMLGGLIEAIPLRVDFIFLTIISTVMGIQTMKGMRRRKLDVTRNSILIGIIVEIALIFGDVILIIEKSSSIGVLPLIRVPFLLLTMVNLSILLYVAHRLKVFSNRNGTWALF